MFSMVLEAVRELAHSFTQIPVYIGANPPKESIGIDGEAGTQATGLNFGKLFEYRMTVNGKSGDQKKILTALEDIHYGLTIRKDYPHGDRWQIYAIETTSSPRLIGREQAQTNEWVYGSTIIVKYYMKGLSE